MTENKRITLNVLATYGRSVYALAIGLLCSRWAYIALGASDYGLMGLVGGLVGMVTFFNGLLSFAVGRFYAVNVGAAKVNANPNIGLMECKKWFNTALFIHTLLPVFLLIVGYPIGSWAISNFLAIPEGRHEACIWVWRFTCASCFVSMVNVPFLAMYTAKQEIAELTIYGFVCTSVTAVFQYYMVTHPGVWIVRFAFWTSAVSIVSSLIILSRAVVKYNECRIVIGYFWDFDRMRQISSYALSRAWSAFSKMIFTQGRSILVNKYMGTVYNASMAIGNSVSSHALTLSSSLSGALWPAISNKAGEGRLDDVHKLSFMACRVGTVLILVFALPLSLEVDEVLRLWLGTPPPFVSYVCIAILINYIFERMTEGYWMAIMAIGNHIVLYSFIVGMPALLAVLLAWGLFHIGLGMMSICLAIVFVQFLVAVLRVILGRVIVGYSTKYWLLHVFVPLGFTAMVSLLAGLLPRLFMSPCLQRIVVTAIFVETVLIPSAWYYVLSPGERDFLECRLRKIISYN